MSTATTFDLYMDRVSRGDRLSPDEMQALLRRLSEAQLAQHCAHGRPTSILLSHRQLARQFGRE